MQGPRAIVPSLALVLLVATSTGCGALKRFGYEGFGRDGWQKPDQVIETLGIAPGQRVADVGAGGGYFTFRLAEAVGADGRVYAVDVDDDMLEGLRDRVADEGHENVEVVDAEFHDPLLPDGAVDLVFTVNTYHHIEDRVAYWNGVLADLAPGGRVAVIELDGSSWFSGWMGHYTERETIVEEMTRAGYALESSPEFLERQSFLIFTPAGA